MTFELPLVRIVPLYWAPAFIIILSDLISPTIRPDLLIITVPLELTLPTKVPLKTRFIDFISALTIPHFSIVKF